MLVQDRKTILVNVKEVPFRIVFTVLLVFDIEATAEIEEVCFFVSLHNVSDDNFQPLLD